MLARDKVESIIGKTFADHLDAVILQAGELEYSRREMVETLGCANFIAAARLEKVLRKLKIDTAKDLWNLDPMSLARSRGIGEASLFVAMCILDANDYDVKQWWGWNDNVVKFSTFKSQAMSRAKKRSQEVA